MDLVTAGVIVIGILAVLALGSQFAEGFKTRAQADLERAKKKGIFEQKEPHSNG